MQLFARRPSWPPPLCAFWAADLGQCFFRRAYDATWTGDTTTAKPGFHKDRAPTEAAVRGVVFTCVLHLMVKQHTWGFRGVAIQRWSRCAVGAASLSMNRGQQITSNKNRPWSLQGDARPRRQDSKCGTRAGFDSRVGAIFGFHFTWVWWSFMASCSRSGSVRCRGDAVVTHKQRSSCSERRGCDQPALFIAY